LINVLTVVMEYIQSCPGGARCEIFMVVKIQVKVFWVVIPCSVAVGYCYFVGPCCLPFYSITNQKTSACLGGFPCCG